MDNIFIRPMLESDEAMINEFFDSMSGESRAFFNRGNSNRFSALKFCKEQNSDCRYFIAELNGKMAGYVFLWDMNTSIPWLGIAVREELKGKHIGRALIAYAQDYAKQNSKGGIQLTTHLANLRGQVLYETMGFERIGIHNLNSELYYLFRFKD
ncbi:MAG: GNAT family N-acetyltransferase [Firmicutes bacterium]|nr:GNAT family N-acetyltransferase [Bacillota bacterium]